MFAIWLSTILLLTLGFLIEWGITFNEIYWWITASVSTEIANFQEVRSLYDYALSLKFVIDLLVYSWYLSIAGFDLVTFVWRRLAVRISDQSWESKEESRHRYDLVACALYFAFALVANTLLPLLADVSMHLMFGGNQGFDTQWMTRIMSEAIHLIFLTIGLLLVSLMEHCYPRGAFLLAGALFSVYIVGEQVFEHLRHVASYGQLPLSSSSKALLDQVGFPAEKCLLGSDYDAHCSLTRITIGRHLMALLTEAEQTAILAHELGHWSAGHPWIRVTWNFIIGISSISLFFLYRHRYAKPHVPLAISLIAFHLLLAPVERVAVSLASNAISWSHERSADRFAANSGHGNSLISALTKITDSMFFGRNIHSTLFGLMYSTHPPNHLRSSLIKS